MEIELEQRDYSLFEGALAKRAPRFGEDDIHGNRNSPGGHAVGLWGEIGVWRWFETIGVPVEWTAKEDDSLPDFVACGRIGIETKAQRPHNWTDELATTVQEQSMTNWLKKEGNKYVVWTVCRDPMEAGVHPVQIMGWDTIQGLKDLGTKTIRRTQQYQTYPNHNQDLGALVQQLRADCGVK